MTSRSATPGDCRSAAMFLGLPFVPAGGPPSNQARLLQIASGHDKPAPSTAT
ncbi:MAG: hypothetical protein IAI50_03955 [Candidatus Eremiobacteraeota bacterium]|nr:hypothetical protein [Candidatus Eremiobacteraeota bacterium]